MLSSICWNFAAPSCCLFRLPGLTVTKYTTTNKQSNTNNLCLFFISSLPITLQDSLSRSLSLSLSPSPWVAAAGFPEIPPFSIDFACFGRKGRPAVYLGLIFSNKTHIHEVLATQQRNIHQEQGTVHLADGEKCHRYYCQQ